MSRTRASEAGNDMRDLMDVGPTQNEDRRIYTRMSSAPYTVVGITTRLCRIDCSAAGCQGVLREIVMPILEVA